MMGNGFGLVAFVLLMLLPAFLPCSVFAEDNSPGGLNLGGQVTMGDSPWEFKAIPFFWFLGIDGTLNAGAASLPININPLELVDDADSAAGFQGRFSAQKGRWGLDSEVLYGSMKFGFVSLPPRLIFGIPVSLPPAKLSGNVMLVELLGTLEFFPQSRPFGQLQGWHWNAEALLGFRYSMLAVGGGLALGLGGDVADKWVDPLLGVAFEAGSGAGWQASARTIIGGFGAGTSFTWSLEALAGYGIPLGDEWEGTLWVGYRILSLDPILF